MPPETVFAIPGDLATPTGGYGYDRRLLALLPQAGVGVTHMRLPGSFPAPSQADIAETARLLAATPAHGLLLIDGLAYGALPASVIAGLGRRVVALVHHPLGLETGLSPEASARMLEDEARALALADAVIVTSAATARLLTRSLRVSPTRITVAEPGTEPAPRAPATGLPPRLLAVGAVSPRKAYGVLIAALEGLADLPWTLTIIGPTERAPDETLRLRAQIEGAGLAERIQLAGAASQAELAKAYHAADLFVMSSLYEGYGMVLGEAMARGLPIVATTGGAAAETIPDGAALKVPPGDIAALRAALARALGDRALRRRLAEASFVAGQALPRWPDTARIVAQVLRETAA